MEKRGQFTFYRSYFEAVLDLPEGEREHFLMAMLEYALYKKEPQQMNAMERAMFKLVRPTLDSGWRKAEAGKIGGKAKRKQNESKGEKEIEIENKKEIKIETETEAEGEDTSAAFDAFWCAYPCQIEKQNAFLVWQRMRPDTQTLRQIMDGLVKWKKSKQWQAQGGRFVPRAARWLEGEYFRQPPEDDTIPKGASGVLGQAEYEAIEKIMEM